MISVFKNYINQKYLDLSIGQRVMVGFSLMLAIGLFATAFSVFNQKVIRDLFVDYNIASEDATLMLAIDNNVIKLQRQILIFSQARDASAISQVKELYSNSLSEIENLNTRHDSFSEADKALIDNLLLSVVQFGGNIQSLEEHRIQSDDRETKLANLYVDAHEVISQLLLSTDNNSVNGTSLLVRQAQGALFSAETLGARYLHKHKFQDKTQATASLNQAIEFLKQAAVLDNAKPVQQKIVDVLASLKVVKTVFVKTVQTDRNYMFLVNIVIGGEISIFRNLSDQLSLNFVERQRRIYATTITSLDKSQVNTWFIALSSAIFAFMVAVTIGRSISRPVQAITRTFTKLARGITVELIPGMKRGDEIGALASAANVFRETNEKTQLLLEQSKLLAEDLERGKEDLQKSNTELDNFAYVASHDLKAPLRAVDNLAQWIKEDCEDVLPEESKEHLNKLQGRIHRMENLLADLLRYSRVGRVDVQKESTNIRLVIDEAIELANKPESFVFNIPADLPDVNVCVAPLVQVIQNLFTNAIKYNDKENGELFVTIDNTAEKYFQLTITDNGPGIESQYHERIFMMFQTLEARDVIEASGMGLAIVKKVVESEGGAVHIESVFGEGSSFIFTWPKI